VRGEMNRRSPISTYVIGVLSIAHTSDSRSDNSALTPQVCQRKP